MDKLRTFAQDERFQNFIDGLLSNQRIEEDAQGLLVGYDRFWLNSLRARWEPYPYWDKIAFSKLRRWKVYNGHDWLDSTFVPNGWDDYNRSRGYPENASPIYIKISMRPGKWQFERQELPRSWEGHPVIYEIRPPCRALEGLSEAHKLRDGLSVGTINPNRSGTAGGLLKEQNSSEFYLVSCAHVLGSKGTVVTYPAPTDRKQTDDIAIVQHSKMPSPSSKGIKCNRVANPSAIDVDVAFAQMYQYGTNFGSIMPMVGQIDRWSSIAEMTSYDPIFFIGKESGLVKGEIGPLVVWYSIEIKEMLHCFSDLFVITPVRPWYINSALAKQGDSGAWVFSELDGSINWDGMLIAGDGSYAFCCFAEKIKRESNTAFPPGLVLT